MKKKNYFARFTRKIMAMIFFAVIICVNAFPQGWIIYDGSIHPIDHQGITFLRSNLSGVSNEVFDTWSTIVNDPDSPGNKILQFVDNASGQRGMWRVNVPAGTTKLTWVARLKAYKPLLDWTIDLDVDFNGTREQFFIMNDNKLRVRRGTDITHNFPEGFKVDEWNIYRFVFDTEADPKTITVYLNEETTPFITAVPATGTNQFFRFGNGDSNRTVGFLMDWMVWDISGAYAPGQGTPLPDFSHTPGADANLSEIRVNGEPLAGFDPNVLQYTLVLPAGTAEVPVISAVAADAAATVVVTQADAIPGTATIEVTAENGFTKKTYTVSIRLVSQDATLKTLQVNGEPLKDFDPQTLNYTVLLPLETTTTIPVVSATANDGNATVAITQATEIEGTATILVTAEDGTTTLTYTLEFKLVSVDATLSDLKVDGTTIAGFDPEKTEYTYLLPAGTTELPVVDAVANNEKATVQITQATGIPGTATVEVTAEDGLTKLTYSVHFIIGSSDATLADLLVNGVTVSGFDPLVTEYHVALPAGTTEVPLVTAVPANENAVVVITPATGIPGTTKVEVTAEDQFTKLEYLVHFRYVSTDASLKALLLDGRAWAAFNPDVLTYEVKIPESSKAVPVVSAVATDDGATVQITQASQIPGTAVIVVTAEDGQTSTTYEVDFVEGGRDWRYYDASVLPNAHVPTFSPSNVGGVGGTNVIKPDPADENNNFLELITAVNADNYMWSTPLQPETPAVTLVMRVKAANEVARRVVELDVHHNGIRERMYINREMNRIRLNEGIGGGDGGEIPAPEGVNLGDWNIYRLTKQGNSTKVYLNENPEPIAVGNTSTSTTNQYFRFGDGNSSHNIAALIDWIVWDETGAYAPGEGLYIPSKVVTPDWNATLEELLVDGTLITGFDPDVEDYEVLFSEAPTTLPVISAKASNENASLKITQAEEFPGVATVEVTAVNRFTVKTYSVTFRLLSGDATLADILIDNVSLQDFAPGVTTYDVVLPAGTVVVPVVTAVAAHPGARVEITQAAALPGSATIKVTAENGTELIYTVNFSVDATGIVSPDLTQLSIFPNPATTSLTLRWNGTATRAYVEIINLTGQVVFSNRLESNNETLDVSHLLQGTYIIRLTSGQGRITKLFIKQ